MTNFESSWNRLNKHEKPFRLSDRFKFDLARLQVKPMTKLSGWLADAVENVPAKPVEGRIDSWLPQRSALIEASARHWIDTLFLSLRTIVQEFDNSSVSQKLQVVIDGPKFTMDLPCRRDPSFSPYRFKCYEGHLASYSWGMLIRSYYESIQVFIVPNEMLLGLEANLIFTNELKVLAEFRAAVNESEVQWALADNTVCDEAIPAIARELFTDFIRLALGILKEADLYTPKPKGVVPVIEEKMLISSQQDQFAATIKDLQLWRTRDLFTRSLSFDMASLTRLRQSTKISDQLHQSQVGALCVHCEDLKVCWDNFIFTVENLTSNCAPKYSPEGALLTNR